ncbi:MAG: DUF4760 domain-containing protein [Pseudomonadota bacterium]
MLELIKDFQTALALLLSTSIAWKALKNNQKIARQKNTIDAQKELLGEEFLEDIRILMEALDNERGYTIEEWAHGHNYYKPTSKSIRDILNAWERLALGIEAGVYDQRMLFKTYKTTLYGIEELTRQYRKERQKTMPSAYTQFDDLVATWKYLERAHPGY